MWHLGVKSNNNLKLIDIRVQQYINIHEGRKKHLYNILSCGSHCLSRVAREAYTKKMFLRPSYESRERSLVRFQGCFSIYMASHGDATWTGFRKKIILMVRPFGRYDKTADNFFCLINWVRVPVQQAIIISKSMNAV